MPRKTALQNGQSLSDFFMATKGPNNTNLAMDFLSEKGENLGFFKCFKQFAEYSDGFYRLKDQHDMRRDVWRYVVAEHRGHNATHSSMKDICSQMEYACPKSFNETSESFIAFKDCLFNTDTFETSPHSSDNPVIFSLPFSYSEVKNADTKPFIDFLKTVLVKENDEDTPDMELIDLMQEIFGYSMMSHVKAEMAFFFIGNGANGKGVTTSMLSEMIGSEYVINMNIEALTTRIFSTSSLVGKRLNISNEEESKYIKSDKLKTLISGESVRAERKFGDPFTFNPTAKFIFCSNNTPSFDDLNYGLRRRFKLVPFHKTFLPKERDMNLRQKLRKHLPGIVRWSIIGGKRLADNGYVFSSPAASEKSARQFENDSSSAIQYLRLNFSRGSKNTSQFVCYQDIYMSYRSWCADVGKHPMHQMNFKKDMKRMDEYSSESDRYTCPNHKKQERGWFLNEVDDEGIVVDNVHSSATEKPVAEKHVAEKPVAEKPVAPGLEIPF